MEFKGTKGKWHHDLGTASIWHPNLIGHRLASVDCYRLEMSEEDLANALLISKAPEMLEMLKSFVNDFDNGLIDDFQIPRDRFEHLIKEATEL